MRPHYPIQDVKAAAAAERFELGGRNLRDRLLPWLRTPLAARQFARSVLMELSEDDYLGSVAYAAGVCDEYGLAISEALQATYDIAGLVTWYVKLRLEKRRRGQFVILLSLHGAERDFGRRRAGGPLKAQFVLRRE